MSHFLLALALLAALILSSCTKPAPTAPAAGPSPAVASTAPKIERTADEVALLEAAAKGDQPTVKMLLERGVNPSAKDPDGRTPLTEAAFNGHTEIAKLLLQHGADPFAKKNDGQTPLTMAAGHKDIAELIEAEIRLLEVAGQGDNAAVRELLDKGAYVNVRDPDGRTPLTEAVWNNKVDAVKLLLDHGADPNARKNDGATPVSIAKGKGYKEISDLLQKAGAR